MKVLLFGASGILGQELTKIMPEIVVPVDRINIQNYHHLKAFVYEVNPDIIINAAAQTNNRIIEFAPKEAINANIIGAANLALIAMELEKRLVYISTDYVYKGDRGYYDEEDELLPVNMYAWTKLGGECSTRAVKNHLIIRTSFGTDQFPYNIAFADQFTSKDYVDVIAPMILKAALSNSTGVMNIGTEKKSMFQYAEKRNENVTPADRGRIDHSLNTKKYKDEIN